MANHATNELELQIVVIIDRNEDDKYVVEGRYTNVGNDLSHKQYYNAVILSM